MFNLDKNSYYVDVELMLELCRIEKDENDEDESTQINVFKYELYKMFLTRVLDEFAETDEDSIVPLSGNSVSFDIALNTLLKTEIIKILEQ